MKCNYCNKDCFGSYSSWICSSCGVEYGDGFTNLICSINENYYMMQYIYDAPSLDYKARIIYNGKILVKFGTVPNSITPTNLKEKIKLYLLLS